MRKAPAIPLVLLLTALSSAPARKGENPHGDSIPECSLCHGTTSWSVPSRPGRFDHATTDFPLRGAHDGVRCAACHTELEFHRVGSACADCHADIHRGDLGTDCTGCHRAEGWRRRDDAFELHAAAGFILLGMHALADCEACHEGQQEREYADTPFECAGCHVETYEATDDPPHASSGFGTSCEDCHRFAAATWSETEFAHSSAFPLTGAHGTVSCDACHTDGFGPLPTECIACHATTYENTTDPDHQGYRFSTSCGECHGTGTWLSTTWDHGAASGFILSGAHRAADCSACHGTTPELSPPVECFDCHESNYDGTTDPDHAAAGIPTDCAACHTDQAWSPAVFDHDATNFPLAGAHGSLECAACHAAGYQGTPTDCFACHESNYSGTTDPNHAAAGFGTDCTACHNTTRWDQTTWNHDADFFPIYSGEHRGKWNTCDECHTDPTDFGVFSCIDCHEHSRSNTDDEHNEVRNYVYQSGACLDCHPTGRGD